MCTALIIQNSMHTWTMIDCRWILLCAYYLMLLFNMSLIMIVSTLNQQPTFRQGLLAWMYLWHSFGTWPLRVALAAFLAAVQSACSQPFAWPSALLPTFPFGHFDLLPFAPEPTTASPIWWPFFFFPSASTSIKLFAYIFLLTACGHLWKRYHTSPILKYPCMIKF